MHRAHKRHYCLWHDICNTHYLDAQRITYAECRVAEACICLKWFFHRMGLERSLVTVYFIVGIVGIVATAVRVGRSKSGRAFFFPHFDSGYLGCFFVFRCLWNGIMHGRSCIIFLMFSGCALEIWWMRNALVTWTRTWYVGIACGFMSEGDANWTTERDIKNGTNIGCREETSHPEQCRQEWRPNQGIYPLDTNDSK